MDTQPSNTEAIESTNTTSTQTPADAPPVAPRRQARDANWRWWLRLAIQPLLVLTAGVLVIVLIGLSQKLGWLTDAAGSGDGTAASASGTATEYICPMMCTPPQSEPGRCPVCAMELVPASAGGSSGDGRSIVVDSAARRIANIQTAEVRAVPATRTIRAVGKLAYDESGLKTLAAYVDGRLDRLFADYTGVRVRRGDRLAVLYSPELYAAQVEYLSARRQVGAAELPVVAETNRALAASARQRLIELGMLERQIEALEDSGEARTRLDLHAEIDGTVIEKLAAEGDYVKAGQAIYRLADLSNLWLMLELFPEQVADVRYGQRVEATVQSLPGETYTGRVAFIDPVVDPKTRTVGVRVVIPNPDGRLRVGDYATARLQIPIGPDGRAVETLYDPELAGKWVSPRHPHVTSDRPGDCPLCGIELVPADELGFAVDPVERGPALVVPRRSVLRAGETSVVYVETKPGTFEPRRVTLGPAVGESVVVIDGLEAGDVVATSGNFLIDSQMQLAGNPSLVDPSRLKPADPLSEPLSPALVKVLEELDARSRERAVEQRICPVTEMPLGSMGVPPTVDVDGRQIFLCCEGCREPLLEEPQRYLARLGSAESGGETGAPDEEAELPPIGPIGPADGEAAGAPAATGTPDGDEADDLPQPFGPIVPITPAEPIGEEARR